MEFVALASFSIEISCRVEYMKHLATGIMHVFGKMSFWHNFLLMHSTSCLHFNCSFLFLYMFSSIFARWNHVMSQFKIFENNVSLNMLNGYTSSYSVHSFCVEYIQSIKKWISVSIYVLSGETEQNLCMGPPSAFSWWIQPVYYTIPNSCTGCNNSIGWKFLGIPIRVKGRIIV